MPEYIKVKRTPLTEQFEDSFSCDLISVLSGQRQIGKTTFIKDFIAAKFSEEEFLYINLDSLSDREKLKSTGLTRFIQNHFKIEIQNFSEKKIIIIDEAPKLPEIFEEVKILFDQFRHQEKIKFILSGSSVLDLYLASAESLAGRVNFKRAFAFNLHEMLLRTKSNLKPNKLFNKIFDINTNFDEIIELSKTFHPSSNSEIQEHINFSINFGSMPQVVSLFEERLSKEGLIKDFIEDYKNTYIEKDVRSLGKIGEISSFSKSFDYLSAIAANLLVKSNISKDIGLSHETIQNYLSVLENTFVIDLVKPFYRSTIKTLVKSPKLYLFDNSLISRAHGYPNLEQISKMGLIGHYFENWVYNEIKKLLFNNPNKPEIFFYRTSDDAEIDFILDYKRKIIPLEIKWTDNPKRMQLTTIKNFIASNGNLEFGHCDYGVVIYNGEFLVDEVNRIVFFPAQYFAGI